MSAPQAAVLREVSDECAFTAALETAWRLEASGARWTSTASSLKQARRVRKRKRRQKESAKREEARKALKKENSSPGSHLQQEEFQRHDEEEEFIPIRAEDPKPKVGAEGTILGTRAVLRELERAEPRISAVVISAKPEAVKAEFRDRLVQACAVRGVQAYALVETTPQLLGKALQLRSIMVLALGPRSALDPNMRRALETLDAK
ncbi:Hypothetical Protein FCC1311_100422 [Hondaea fermentalgiana]|uniref:Uncharacterized protein n=1 Tax=Hondaea fermentalgiana TaxID=2315210 RepID=A0A2R5GU20_9STRA|nr:Hypothetical Protein FCC1311_100422 [Hondaea fermentalgiana]|eukprot:GBG33819.1 Hypothetical Protein FCC1311_100422 [Hondaea fermentalgiana]